MRGEYLCYLRVSTLILGSPPLARGILKTLTVDINGNGITPACAGNTIPDLSRPSKNGDHPRLRGEYIFSERGIATSTGSPPLARGIQRKSVFNYERAGITPACAGNTTSSLKKTAIPWDHPRLRGEYMLPSSETYVRLGSPPLARGIQRSRMIPRLKIRITPACAGNTKHIHLNMRHMRDHPRLRGEYMLPSSETYVRLGSPPLARGIH